MDAVVGSMPWSEVTISRSPGPQRVEDVGKAAVEVLQAAMEVLRVVAVAPEHVGLDEIREHEAGVDVAQQLLRRRDPLDVRLRGVLGVHVEVGEDVGDLPDAVHLAAGFAHERQVVRPPRLEREVVAVRRPLVVPRLADERPRDHAPDRVLSGEDPARRTAARVELLEGDRLLVRRDLEDRVRRRVDDPLARLLVLLAELLDDLRPGGRLVAEHAARRLVHERVDHVVGKAVRIRRQRLRRDDAHHLPVPERRVLALRALEQAAGDRGRARHRRHAFEIRDVAETQGLHVRQVEPADGARDVSERVRLVVSELCCVRQGARAHAVQHDHARARHGAIV